MPKVPKGTKRSKNTETAAKTLAASSDDDHHHAISAAVNGRTENGRFVPDQDKWFQKYRELQKFRQENRHCIVLRTHATLGNWCNRQRSLYRQGRLAIDRQEKLNLLGFSWDRDAERWETRYLELMEYKQLFNSCNVPRRYRDNPQLARWVESQRNYYNNDRSKISPQRIEKLNAIGFKWCDNRKMDWEFRFQQLLRFQQQHGHTCVPQKYPPNPALGNWVMSQRYFYRKRRLVQDKIDKLLSVGFVWAGRHQFLINDNDVETTTDNKGDTHSK